MTLTNAILRSFFVTYLDKRIFITPTISYLSKPDVKQLYSRYLMKYNLYPALTCCSTVQVGVSSQSAVEISCESLRNFVSLRLKAEALDVFRFNILCAGKPLKLLMDIHRWEPWLRTWTTHQGLSYLVSQRVTYFKFFLARVAQHQDITLWF